VQDNGTGRIEVAEHRCRRFASRGEKSFDAMVEAEAALRAAAQAEPRLV